MKKILIVLVILIGIISCESKKNGKFTAEQKGKLAYGSVLLARNEMIPGDTYGEEESQASLKEYWDVNNTEQAKSTLDWLLNEGHRTQIDEFLPIITDVEAASDNSLGDVYLEAQGYQNTKKQLIDNYKLEEKDFENFKTISAWDYDRLVTVALMSYSSKYITEEELWSYIDKAVEKAKADYNNWNEYFISVIVGRILSYNGNFDENKEVANRLLLQKNSPYKKYKFK